MITYHYKCEVCDHEFEIAQSIKDKPLKLCTCCNQHKLYRVIHGGIDPIVQGEAKTVGVYASRVMKKMGKYEKEDKRKEYKDAQKAAKQELRKEAEKKLGRKLTGLDEAKPEVIAKNNKINKMTPEQKIKYIETGKGL